MNYIAVIVGSLERWNKWSNTKRKKLDERDVPYTFIKGLRLVTEDTTYFKVHTGWRDENLDSIRGFYLTDYIDLYGITQHQEMIVRSRIRVQGDYCE